MSRARFLRFTPKISKKLHHLKTFPNFYCLKHEQKQLSKAFLFHEILFSQFILETSSDEDVLKFTEATHTRINGRSFVTEMCVVVIHLRPVYTKHILTSILSFLIKKGTYTLTLCCTTNITRLEFRILMITLIQFYKSKMRSTYKRK